jgi:hypothetical protein
MARARALVMEINSVARQNPGESARFQESASRWADALYAKRDHRAALDAYAMISALGAPDTEHSQWARYQEANCLLQMADYETAAKAFDIISQSSSSWAAEAAVKSSYARLEQQVRGLPVTPVGVEDESQKQGQQANAARPGATG